MKTGRQAILIRSLLAIVAVAILVFQVEPIFACRWMEDQAQSHCCCDDRWMATCNMQDGCDGRRSDASGSCCEVFYQVTAQLADDPLLRADDFTLVYHELPLAATWFVAALVDFLPAKPSTGVHLERQVTWNSGTATYLITQRLRD